LKLATALLASGFIIFGQTFRSGVEGVHIDVLVVDGNRPVSGLRAADFEVRDSGVLQRVDSVALEDVPLNVILALDTSESVQGAPLEQLKAAAIAAIELLRPTDQAAVLTFNDYVTLRADWTTDRTALTTAIRAVNAGGATALHDAAYSALTMQPSQPGRRLALVFSDGEDTVSWLTGGSAIEVARRNDAVLYAVELGMRGSGSPGYRLDLHSGLQIGAAGPLSGLMDRFLDALARDTGGQVLNAARPDQIHERFVRIITEFRTRYLITYSPAGVERGGWHPLDVTLKNRKGRVTARRGYLR
jgi:Ca-activated chloride channel family protein